MHFRGSVSTCSFSSWESQVGKELEEVGFKISSGPRSLEVEKPKAAKQYKQLTWKILLLATVLGTDTVFQVARESES